MKRCTKCGKEYPESEFFLKGQKANGEPRYQTRCKECHMEASRKCQRARDPRPRELRNDKFKLAGFICY